MIFIDFDDTIYNTKKFKEEYYKIFEINGISKDVFEQTYYSENDNNKGQIYDYNQHIERIEKMSLQNMQDLKRQIGEFLGDTSKFVFSDFGYFAKSLKRDELILVSYGRQPFQGTKISSSGISDHFKRTIVTGGKKSSVVKQVISENMHHKQIFFLDDRPDQIEDVRSNIKDIIPIRIKRRQGRYKELKLKSKNITELGNLKQATKYIKEKQNDLLTER